MRKINTRKNRRNKKKILVIAGVILIVMAIMLGLYLHNRNTKDADQADAATRPVQNAEEDKTREEESEGVVFPVPDDVPDDAIKNYQLVVENEQYKIRKDQNSDSYLITLYAIINRPDQYDMYRDQLADYKRNALHYLRDRGVNTDRINIKYEPEEATDL